MKYLTYLFPSIILLSVSFSIYSGQISKVNNIDIWWDSFGEETDPPCNNMIMGHQLPTLAYRFHKRISR